MSPHAFRCVYLSGYASGSGDYDCHDNYLYTTECTMSESKLDLSVSFDLNYHLAYAHIGMDPVLHLCIAAKKWTSVGRPDRSW